MMDEYGGIKMNLIMVIGVSSGVGKSTFAMNLGEALNINVHHLDTLYWKAGWIKSSKEEFPLCVIEYHLFSALIFWIIGQKYKGNSR